MKRDWRAAVKGDSGRRVRLPLFLLTWSVLASSTALATDDPSVRPIDYVIIRHSVFSDASGTAYRDLRDFKQGQGYQCTEFMIGDGVHRDSIKQIVSNLYGSRDYPPLYVLLIGRAKGDPNNYNDSTSNSSTGNLIPTFYDQDLYDHRASYDQWYAWLEPNDSWRRMPRVIVGRIPAQSEAQLRNYVNKLMYYESDTSNSSWKEQAHLVSGDYFRNPWPQDPSPQSVYYAINLLRDSLSPHMTVFVQRHSD